jgi:hypothetical protein
MYLLAVSLSILLAGALGASEPSAPQPDAVISIDFVATTGDGQHAAGLTPADVSLKVGGRERPIRDLEVVTVNAGPAIAPPSAAGSRLPPPYGETLTVGERNRRSILLLVDEGTLFGMEQVLRDAVAKLVASLSPADRLGVASTRPDSISVPLTTDHQKVRAAVDSLSLGRGNPSLCFGGVVRQVVSLAQLLPAGRASTLAVLSRGGGVANPQGSGSIIASGECMIRREELLPIANAISATQINYRVFNVGAAGASSALEDFAGSTGAETNVLSFAEAGGLARAAQAAAQFYRATVSADASRHDQLERVELRVNRPGVKVSGPTHVSLEPVRPPIVDAASLLRGQAVRSDLPLRIAAFASKNEGARSAKLLVVVEPAEAGTTFAEAIVSVVGANGEVAGQWTARPEDLARVPLMAALPVVPGSYRVRAAVVDGRNRAALAEYSTDTLQGTGEVKMSSLVLGVSPKGEFTPRLLFGGEPSGVAYLEIYNARASANVDVLFELAASPDGPVLAKIPAQMSAGQTHTAIGQIPVGTLPVGDTLVRAVVTIDGAPAGQTVRTLRKSAR